MDHIELLSEESSEQEARRVTRTSSRHMIPTQQGFNRRGLPKAAPEASLEDSRRGPNEQKEPQ